MERHQNESPAVSLVHLAYLLYVRRGLLIAGTSIAFAGTMAWALFSPRSYSVETAFVAQQKRAQAGLTGLAAQVGLSIGNPEPGQSPGFYADLLLGRNISLRVVQEKYHWGAGRDSGTLADFLRVSGPNNAIRDDRAVEKLHDALSVVPQQKTGVVRVRVTLHDSTVARDVAIALTDQVDRFNRQVRRSQATAEREFAASRLKEAGLELRQSEDRLESFLRQNRSYQSSPSLIFDHDRLVRDLSLRQQTYASLTQSLEQARLDEIRDTPVLTIVEPAIVPATPDRRGLLSKLFVIEILTISVLGTWIVAPILLGFRNLPDGIEEAIAGHDVLSFFRGAQ